MIWGQACGHPGKEVSGSNQTWRRLRLAGYDDSDSQHCSTCLPTPHGQRIDNKIAHSVEFKSHGPLAQLVEQLTLNQRVAGSSPARLILESNT